MKILAAAALALSLTAGAAFAGDITGVWSTPSDNGKVQISQCGQGICGRLIDADQIRANPNQLDENNKNAGQRSPPAFDFVSRRSRPSAARR